MKNLKWTIKFLKKYVYNVPTCYNQSIISLPHYLTVTSSKNTHTYKLLHKTLNQLIKIQYQRIKQI